MNRTECTLKDVANKINEEFLRIGLPIRLEDFLTSEEYETFRFALKGILPDNCEENWNTINRVYQKVDKLAADVPTLKLAALSAMPKNSKPKFKLIGFESGVFKILLKQVNEFINSDECEEFIDFDFKITERSNHQLLYSGFVKYRAPAQD